MESHFIVLRRGQEIAAEILKFCSGKGIKAAYISALGAVSSAELSYYDMQKKEYLTKNIEGDLEITNITGNIALIDGKHVLHAHITLSDRSYKTTGGHLKSGIVSGTCEVFVVPLKEKLVRSFDRETGLNLIQ